MARVVRCPYGPTIALGAVPECSIVVTSPFLSVMLVSRPEVSYPKVKRVTFVSASTVRRWRPSVSVTYTSLASEEGISCSASV